MTRYTTSQAGFGCRVAGIAIHNQHLLLQGEPHSPIWTLPGGGVEILESTHTALTREMREELDVDIRVDRLLWIAEEFFLSGHLPQHQVSFYYQMTFMQRSGSARYAELGDVRRVIHTRDGAKPILFQWFSLGVLDQLTLYPRFLAHGVLTLPHCPRHLILIDDQVRPFVAPW